MTTSKTSLESNDLADSLIKDAGEAISWACGRYDAGLEEMALQIAVAAKPLFHPVAGREPLLAPHHRTSPVGLRSTTSFGVTEGNTFGFIMLAPNKAGFHPEFSRGIRNEEVVLDDWWAKEPILRFPRTPPQTITRQQVILAATGDFADPHALSAADYRFMEDGFKTRLQAGPKGGPLRWITLKSAHLAILRQIGYEILSSPDIQRLAGVVPGKKAPPKPLPPKVEIEPEMNRFVRSFGGQVVADLVGPSPDFLNADYFFPEENVIAELKCVTEDKSDDENLREKLQQIFDRCLDEGVLPDPGPGLHVFETKNAPVAVQREIYALFGKSVKRRLAKANNQIKRTREKFNRPDARGLVLLANDGNFHLEPAQWAHAVQVALGRDFSAINSIVLFTVNQLAATPKLGQHTNLWIVASRTSHPEVSEVFLHRFGEGWAQHFAKIIGQPVPMRYDINAKDLELVKYDRNIFDAPR